MAKEVLLDASISVGGVDLSSFVKSVTLTPSFDAKECTAFGDTAVSRLAGLKDWELSIDWYGDYAASSVYATIAPLIGTSAECIIAKDATASTSATNPTWTGDFIITEFPFIDAEIGELHEFSTTWPGDGDITIGTGA